MKKTYTNSILRVLALVIGLSFATQASARLHLSHASTNDYHIVKIGSVPYSNLIFSTANNTSENTFSGIFYVPNMPTAKSALLSRQDGGDDDGDTTNDEDSIDDHDDDHDGDHDSTDDDGDHDSTDHHDDLDSNDHDGDNDSNDLDDTIEIDEHHHGDHDTSATEDTTDHALFNGRHQSITIKSHGSQANFIVPFVNNLSTSVTITDMKLATGTNFSIVSGAPTLYTPATLAPGAKLMLKIAFTTADKNLHSDQLIVTSNSAMAQSTITLQGIQVAQGAIMSTLPTGVSISMMPNPMSTSMKLNLTGISKAFVTIYDFAGKLVVAQNISSTEWLWNGTASDGARLGTGTYIVRITGESADGNAFTTSEKIILQR